MTEYGGVNLDLISDKTKATFTGEKIEGIFTVICELAPTGGIVSAVELVKNDVPEELVEDIMEIWQGEGFFCRSLVLEDGSTTYFRLFTEPFEGAKPFEFPKEDDIT